MSDNTTPFRVEQRGIDYVEPTERWATPRSIAGLWAGVSTNVQYFVYGAILVSFGFSVITTIGLILLGNLSYLLLAVASLQGPEAGTTTFTISRASFGVRGSRLMSYFNWITQLGFETEGLILISGGVITLLVMSGHHVSALGKVVIVILSTLLMVALPSFGHATMVTVLRKLIIPFVLAYVALMIAVAPHSHLAHSGLDPFANWQLYSVAFAFSFTLAGLSWTENGNDYTRYIARHTPKRQIVAWLFSATAVPQIFTMIVGVVTCSAIGTPGDWVSVNPFNAFVGSHVIPSWLSVAFILMCLIQLFGINALDLYSSGVSLQALGLRVKRQHAVLIDGVISGGLTIWVTFASTFADFMRVFVGVVIVWIVPWLAIYLTDWALRRCRYDEAALQDTSPRSAYYGLAGVNWNALSALLAGMTAALSAYSKPLPPISFPPHWMTPLSNHFGASFCDGVSGCGARGWIGGADFSIPLGFLVATLTYCGLEISTNYITRQRGGASPTRPSRWWLTTLANVLVVASALVIPEPSFRLASVVLGLIALGSLVYFQRRSVVGARDRVAFVAVALFVGLAFVMSYVYQAHRGNWWLIPMGAMTLFVMSHIAISRYESE
jgi:purine-cytosine permease-like protein